MPHQLASRPRCYTLSPAHSTVGRLPAALLVLAALPAGGAERPIPVSPGADQPGSITEARCPTFSWASVRDASGYELAVYRIATEPDEAPVLVARAALPGGARGYTPPVSQCLERGARYAWSVAATSTHGPDDPHAARLDWAPAMLFEVEAAPSGEELERAIATIQRHLDASDLERVPADATTTRSRPAEGGGDSAVSRTKPVARPRPPANPALDALPGPLTALTTGPRIASAASTPTLGAASLTVGNQIHLAALGNVFKEGDVFLWDDITGNTALGRGALAYLDGNAFGNTAVGRRALRNTTGGAGADGSNNTAVGTRALYSNTTGYLNTASGHIALRDNETGSHNTATGALALLKNTTGYDNTASGYRALYANTTGVDNTASGFRALSVNSTGDHNTALGSSAGVLNTTGSNSIFINNTGVAGDHATIRIGTFGVQATAFLAGDLGLGFASGAPANRLHVREPIDGDGGVPGNHVVQIENSSTGNGADVLALKVGLDHDDGVPSERVNASMNFVTFFDGDNSILGEIQGTTTGGIELVSGNADFAEWLPRLDRGETLEPGDVVGLHAAGLAKRTSGATRAFVVSTAPIVTGNDPGERRHADHARVAFLGQAPVKVRGRVHAGDLLVSSGHDDGVAVALEAGALPRPGQPQLPVGRALEPATGDGVRSVLALIGLPGDDTSAALVARQAREIAMLEARLAKLERRARASG